MHKAEVWHYRADIKQRYSMLISQKKLSHAESKNIISSATPHQRVKKKKQLNKKHFQMFASWTPTHRPSPHSIHEKEKKTSDN